MSKSQENVTVFKRQCLSMGKVYLLWSLIYLVIQIPDWIETGWFSVYAFIDWGVGFIRNGSYYHLWYLLCLIYALPVCYFVLKWFHVNNIIYIALFLYALEVIEYGYRIFLPDEVQGLFALYDKGGCLFVAITRALPFLLLGIIIAHRGVVRFKGAVLGFVVSFALLIAEAGMLKHAGQPKVSYITMTFLTAYFFFCIIKHLDAKIKLNNSKIFAVTSATIYYIHPLSIKILQGYIDDNPMALWGSVVVLSTVCAAVINYERY